MKTYDVDAIWDGKWWVLIAEGVDGRGAIASQARRLDLADAAIREAVSLTLEIDEDAFGIHLRPSVPADPDTLTTIDLRRRLAELEREAQAATPAAVADLRSLGLTTRDVGTLLGVSAPRISQIENATG